MPIICWPVDHPNNLRSDDPIVLRKIMNRLGIHGKLDKRSRPTKLSQKYMTLMLETAEHHRNNPSYVIVECKPSKPLPQNRLIEDSSGLVVSGVVVSKPKSEPEPHFSGKYKLNRFVRPNHEIVHYQPGDQSVTVPFELPDYLRVLCTPPSVAHVVGSCKEAAHILD